jgi:response regulator RpfG family c-di-GMP phosphodiesterase
MLLHVGGRCFLIGARRIPRNGSRDRAGPYPSRTPALEIPYRHHGKRDGIGYVRGLKGEGILLAARLFSAVDIWDSFRSDRLYWPTWPTDKTLDSMHRLRVGRNVRPLVYAFTRLIASNSSTSEN